MEFVAAGAVYFGCDFVASRINEYCHYAAVFTYACGVFFALCLVD